MIIVGKAGITPRPEGSLAAKRFTRSQVGIHIISNAAVPVGDVNVKRLARLGTKIGEVGKIGTDASFHDLPPC